MTLLSSAVPTGDFNRAVLGADVTTKPTTGRGEGSSETAGNKLDGPSEKPYNRRLSVELIALQACRVREGPRSQTSGGPMQPAALGLCWKGSGN